MGNALKTALLLGLLTGFMILVGDWLGGQNGMIMALGLAAVMNFVSYFFSDKIALMYQRAQPVTREQLPRVYAVVERITPAAGLPMPKIYVIPTDSPNAFATGRNPSHASVAVTQGILNLLNDDELEGVLAHELGHVRNRDILISSIAATLAGAITILARMAGWAAHVRRHGRTRPRRSWRRRPRRTAHADPRAHCGHAHPARCVALARVSGRRHRRALYRQSLRTGQRPAEVGCLFETDPHASLRLRARTCSSCSRCWG